MVSLRIQLYSIRRKMHLVVAIRENGLNYVSPLILLIIGWEITYPGLQ